MATLSIKQGQDTTPILLEGKKICIVWAKSISYGRGIFGGGGGGGGGGGEGGGGVP